MSESIKAPLAFLIGQLIVFVFVAEAVLALTAIKLLESM